MTLAHSPSAKVLPIAKKKRKLTADEKAQRKEARMNVTVSVVDDLRLRGGVYRAKLTILESADVYGLDSLEFLFSIMSCARPYKSESCNQFIENNLCAIIDGLVGSNNWYTDDIGNVIVYVGSNPTTLWSCHTDTVHPKHTGYSDLVFDSKYVTSLEKRQLGADDGVGIWIMLNMLEAGVQGLYVFHAGEEVGGIGSSYIAAHTPQLLKGITHAIAFDRKSTCSVITHMGYGGRCCSDEFANDFASKLNIGLFPDSTGLYTDTAEYTSLVPECTNISAGYYSEHTFSEYLDYTYAQKLLSSILAADRAGDLDSLVVSRDCNDLDDWDDGFYDRDYKSLNKLSGQTGSGNKYYDNLSGAAFGKEMTLLDIVKTHPQGIVTVLNDFAIDEKYLMDYLGIEQNNF